MADYRTDSQRRVDLTKDVGARPQYEQLMDYLSARRAVPPTKFAYLGDSTSGEFVRNTMFGNEFPSTGVIRLNRGAGADTFIHELTHAATAQLVNQYAEEPNKFMNFSEKAAPTQFTDALQKILRGAVGKDTPPVELANALDPFWTAANKDYRATSGELLGFAMGNMVPTKSGKVSIENSRGPAHLDATLATDMMILLDLATRAQKAKPQSQGR